MNHTLDQFTDNPIIDELVCWPPRQQKVLSIRASAPMFRNPFIEITLDNNEVLTRQFGKAGFATDWAEAKVILETLTAVELIAEFKLSEHSEREQLMAQVLAERDESISEAGRMFEHGMYQQYLWQFGEDYKGLPDQVMRNIALAKTKL